MDSWPAVLLIDLIGIANASCHGNRHKTQKELSILEGCGGGKKNGWRLQP